MNNVRALKHLNFKTFSMVSWGPNLVLVCLFNQGYKHLGFLHKCNSQSGSAFGNHWASSFGLSYICENVFHTQTHFLDLMGLCTLYLVLNSMLRL